MNQPFKEVSTPTRRMPMITREGITQADGNYGIAYTGLDSVATGSVDANAPGVLTDTSKSFVMAGVKIGDWLLIGTDYYPIINLDRNNLWVTGSPAAGTGLTYSVLASPPRKDFARSRDGIVMAVFNGDATEIRVALEMELDEFSTYRAYMDDVRLLGAEASGAAAALFKHGGTFVSPRVLEVKTGTNGSVDLYVIQSPYED